MKKLLIVLLSSFVAAGTFSIMAPKARLKERSDAKAKAKQTAKAPGGVKAKDPSGKSVKVAATSVPAVMRELYPHQIDRWAGKPPAYCNSCDQSTGNIDKHSASDRPRYLHWVQARRTAASSAAASSSSCRGKNKTAAAEADDRFPSGCECYPCYDVRRKFYPGKSQEALKTLREDPKVDDQVNDYRHDLVSGEGKYKGKVQKVSTVEKGEQSFDREFVSGTGAGIWDFARKRHIQAANQDELVDIIRQRYPDYKIVVAKNGGLIVEILDQNDGEYRFERGTNDYIEYHKLEVYDNADDQKEAFNNKILKREAKDLDRIVSDGAGPTSPQAASSAASVDSWAETQAYPDTQLLPPGNRTVPPVPPATAASLSTSSRAASVVQIDSQSQSQVPNISLARLKASSQLGASSDGGRGLPLASRMDSDSLNDKQSVAPTDLEDAQGNGIEGSPRSVSGASAAGSTRKAQDERFYQEDPKTS